MNIPSARSLEKIYKESSESARRFQALADAFASHFREEQPEYFTSPGRTEIIGNHTDHNGGKIIASSIDLDTIGAAAPNGTDTIHLFSEGYRREVVVNLSRIASVEKASGTTALVAGIMEYLQKKGFKTGGFDACVSTRVISAAGVSSSASFEMLVCAMVNSLFNEGRMACSDYARAGQYAENVFWKKSSGLMDQMACAVGGPIVLDFSDPEEIRCESIDFSFEKSGYSLVIVNTGGGHADLSEEYSSIPSEMRQAAAVLGAGNLCETSLEALLEHVNEIPNDRAVLRAIHFFEENRRVEEAREAIGADDAGKLLQLMEESGRSSWELLQNCYSLQDCTEQKITLMLALTELFLKKTGAGVCRVHGGGFAGVIMVVLPLKDSEAYVEYISRYAGRKNVYPMNLRATGAVHID